MSLDEALLSSAPADLFEDAPCGYISTMLDGTILQVNRTFETWTGRKRDQLVAGTRLQDLLAPGARIHYETHLAPLLRLQGSISEIAVEVVHADGSRLPAQIHSVIQSDESGEAQFVSTMIFDASERRRYEQGLLESRRSEHELALQLQRGLLAESPSRIEGLELEVVYQAGRRGTEVGGDWWDAFRIGSEDEVMLVVGDVVGHGIGSAVEMGQLRSAVRTLAGIGLSPPLLLSELDRFAQRHAVGRSATLVCASLDLRSGELVYSCAGHPPPLLIEPGEPPKFLWDGRALPVGTSLAAPARPAGELSLKAGSTLVFYTDGLIEQKGVSIDARMEHFARIVEAHRHQTPKLLIDRLVRNLHDPSHHDDICLLGATFEGATTPD